MTSVILMAVYCHQCRAWTVHLTGATQHGDRSEKVGMPSTVTFGPFDTVYEVEEHCVGAIAYMLLSPGRPWDTGRAETPEVE